MATKQQLGNGERMLVIEDNDVTLKFVTIMLKSANYNVVETKTAEDAFDIFQRENGRFRLIICDVVLPGMNGIQLVKKLFGMNPKLKILMCSGYNKEILGKIVSERKNVQFLPKPFGADELLDTIKNIL